MNDLPAVIPGGGSPFHQSTGLAVRESAASAVAAQARAMVEARYVMALQRPRNWDVVRQDLLNECKRPAFAHNKSAWYVKPIGKGVEGLGIRFVEVALRCMRNVSIETFMIAEDEWKEVVRVSVTDLESNLPWSLDVKVSKTVERSKPADDGSYLSVRKNSYNKDVYTIPAGDDDLLNKRAALISKAVRTLGLRVIPGDLQDEAEALIKKIRADKAAADPGAERKAIADAFGELGVPVDELLEYIGHSLDTCSPAELVRLRGLYNAIKDGEATWQGVLDAKSAEGEGAGGKGKTPPAGKGVSGLKDAMKPAAAAASGGAAAAGPAADPAAGAAAAEKKDAGAAASKPAGRQSVRAQAVTYAFVADKLNAARAAGDPDLLDVQADLIRHVADESVHGELNTLYKTLRAELVGGGS